MVTKMTVLMFLYFLLLVSSTNCSTKIETVVTVTPNFQTLDDIRLLCHYRCQVPFEEYLEFWRLLAQSPTETTSFAMKLLTLLAQVLKNLHKNKNFTFLCGLIHTLHYLDLLFSFEGAQNKPELVRVVAGALDDGDDDDDDDDDDIVVVVVGIVHDHMHELIVISLHCLGDSDGDGDNHHRHINYTSASLLLQLLTLS